MTGQEHYRGIHRFGSAKHLGENAEGTWTLTLTDEQTGDEGRLISWRLKAYGHGQNPGHVTVHPLVAGGGAITVTWDAPTEIGGSEVTSYDLRYLLRSAPDTSDANWTVVTNAGSLTDRSHTVTGLEGEERYRVAVRAVNSGGEGPWVFGGVIETLAVKPGRPRSVAVAARNQALAVSWREPSFLGAGVEAYDIWYIRDDAADKTDPSWSKVPGAWSAGAGELRHVIRGLDNGVTYQVRVRATNSRGDGDWAPVQRRAPADVNSPAEFPSTETGRRSIPENTAPGVNIGDPVSARDDESDTLTYSLTAGAAHFDIVSTTGQLQTKAALDRERTSSYSVTVAVHDGRAADGTASTATDDTIRLSVAVEDVDEPPAVTGGETPTVRENQAAVASYRASDPERASTMFTWSLDGDDAGAFAMSESGVLTFDPAPDFEAPVDRGSDNTYEVTVRATDETATDPAAMTGGLGVRVTVQDVDEAPEISGTDTFVIAEDSSPLVGSYTATDPEGTDTSWLTLAGPDARYFTLDDLTGQLSFADAPDYEARSSKVYRVTVRASDESNRIGTLPVTITLTNVDEPPIIGGPAEVTVNEGHTGPVASYSRRDPEGAATNWAVVGQTAALTGADADRFEFDKAAGRLTFAAPPDYEDGGARYRVTLNANDGSLNSTLDIVVDVTNLEERGSLILDRRRPILNRQLTATLEDGDGVVAATESWQWQRSRSRTGGWTNIPNADSSSYTAGGDDRDHYLRATVEYTDGFDAGNRLQATSEFTATNDRLTNTPPVLPDSVEEISLPENTRPGRNVGSPVRATDAENDPLLYALSGSSDFAIDRTSAQITVADGVALDFDAGQRRYSLTVTADDGFGGTDTASVTVAITDVNEAPEATDDSASTDEDEAVSINVLRNDSDPESAGLTVSAVRRPRHGTATLEADNTITYTPDTDYHGADTFTYTASDGSLRAEATVSVNVRAVNDAPEFATATADRTVSESAEEGDDVGAPVAATDIDGDRLTYRLSGADAFSFDIDGSGQITVGTGVTFDIATQETYTVTVEADDGNGGGATAAVTITVTRRPPPIVIGPLIGIGGGGGGPSGPTPSEEDFEWTVEHDIEELDPGHERPSGSWSDGVTLWLLDNPDGAGDAVYAYDLTTGERVPEREFDLDETNRAPRGLWSDRDHCLGLGQRPGHALRPRHRDRGAHAGARHRAPPPERRRARHLVRRRDGVGAGRGPGRALRLRPGDRRSARRVRARCGQRRPARHLVRRRHRLGLRTTTRSASSPTACRRARSWARPTTRRSSGCRPRSSRSSRAPATTARAASGPTATSCTWPTRTTGGSTATTCRRLGRAARLAHALGCRHRGVLTGPDRVRGRPRRGRRADDRRGGGGAGRRERRRRPGRRRRGCGRAPGRPRGHRRYHRDRDLGGRQPRAGLPRRPRGERARAELPERRRRGRLQPADLRGRQRRGAGVVRAEPPPDRPL